MTIEGGSGIFADLETQGADPAEPPVMENATPNPSRSTAMGSTTRNTAPSPVSNVPFIAALDSLAQGPSGQRNTGMLTTPGKQPINRDNADYAAAQMAVTMSLFNSTHAASSPFQQQLITSVTDQLYRTLDEQDPAILRYINESVAQAAQLEDLRNGIASGEVDVSGMDFELATFADAAWEAGASQYYVWGLQDRQARTIDNLDTLRIPFSVTAELDDLGEAGPMVGRMEAIPTGFAMDAEGNMAVSYRRGDTERTLIARGLNPNVDINNQADLWAEVRRAAERGDLRSEAGDLMGVAEALREAAPEVVELGRDIRDRPWGGLAEAALQLGETIGGTGFNLVGQVLTTADQISGDPSSGTPLLDRIAQRNVENAQKFFTDQSTQIYAPAGVATIMLANIIQGEAQAQGVEVSDSEALATAREFMTPAEAEEAGQAWKDATVAALLEQAEAAGENLTAADVAMGVFDENVQRGLEKLELWDDLAQFIGANILDLVYDGAQWVADPDGMTADGQSRFDEFVDTVDWGTSAAAEFGIDEGSSAGQGLNLGVSILFDPTNVIGVGAGGKAIRRITEEALSDARFADAFIDLPQIRRVIDTVASPDTRTARFAALELEGLGAHAPEVWRLASDPASTRQQVTEAVRAALPSTPGEGTFIGFTPGWSAARNQALGVAKVVENWDTMANTRFGRNVINWLTKGSAERSIAAGDTDAMIRVIRSMWAADPDQAFKWTDEFMSVVDNHNMLGSARRGELAARLDELNELDRSLTGQGRRLQNPNTVRQEIDKLVEMVRQSPSERILGQIDPAATAPAFPGGRAMFHGSAQPITTTLPIGEASAGDNLVGPALYTTDSPTIATTPGYGGREGGSVQSIQWTGDVPPVVVDLDAPADQTLRGVVDEFLAATPTERGITTDEWRRMLDDETMPGMEFYAEMREAFTPAQMRTFNEMLRDAGVDGLRHTGGLRRGKGGETHEVVAWLRPERLQVSEAVSSTPTSVLEQQIQTLSRQLSDEVVPRWNEHAEAIKPVRREKAKLSDLLAEDQVSYLPRAQADLVYRMWDDAAERLNDMWRKKNPDAVGDLIPVKTNDAGDPVFNRLAPTVPVRDWSKISHTGRSLDFGDQTQLMMAAGLADDDPAMLAATSALNPFARLSSLPTPVSTAELLTAFATGGDMAILGKAHESMIRETARQASRFLRSVWGMNVLFNPVTPIKTSGDEALRAFLNIGGTEGIKVATGMQVLGTPGVGRLLEKRLITNPGADSLMRGISEGGRDWQWLVRSGSKYTAEQRQHVARFVNGNLLNSEMMQTFFRASVDNTATWIDDAASPGGRRLVSAPESWVDWWNRTGRHSVRSKTVTMEGQKLDITDPHKAYEMMNQIFDHFLDRFVDPNHQGAVRARLVEAITRGKGDIAVVGDDARYLNYFKKVPANLQNNDSIADTLFGSAWEALYGAPSRRRGAYYTQHEFEYAMNIYRQAYSAKNGKVLITAEELVKRGMSPDDAALAIRQGASHPAVRQALNETGGMTERQLEMAARRWANQRARDISFDMTAGSAFGKKIDNPALIPFGRAQTDFVDWYTKYLSRPLTMGRIGVERRTALAQHPALAKAVLGVERAPAPVNLATRLIRNYSHAQGVFGGEDDGRDPSYIERALDELTFLPGPWNNSPMSRVVPTPGVGLSLPWWMVEDHLIDENSEGGLAMAQAVVQRVWPMLEWGKDADLFDYFLPNSRRSLRNMGVSTARTIHTLVGAPVNTQDSMLDFDRSLWAKTLNLLEGSREPQGASVLIKAYMGEWLRDNAMGVNVGSEEWLEQMTGLVERGIGEANLQTGSQDWQRYVNPLPPGFDERQVEGLTNYERLLADESLLGLLAGAGVISQNFIGADSEAPIAEWTTTQAYARYQSGEATADDINYLYESLTGAVFDARQVEYLPGTTYQDLLLVQYPELAANIVSTVMWSGYEPTDEWGRDFRNTHVTPEGYVHDLDPGARGREARTRALDEGILIYRPPLGEDGYLADAQNAVLQAAGRLTRGLWQFETGKEWSSYSTNRTDSDTGRQVSGLPASWRDRTMRLSDLTLTVAQSLGIDLPPNPTFQDFREILQGGVDKTATAITFGGGVLDASNGAVKELNAHGEDANYGPGLVNWIDESMRYYEREFGISRFSDMPAEAQTEIRAEIAEAMNRGYLTESTYEREWSYIFGPDPREDNPVTVPTVTDLQQPIVVTAEDRDAGLLRVVDGDTLELTFPEDGGTLPIRIIGLGAPEKMADPAGYEQAYRNMRELVESGREITFGLYDADLFGTTQLQGPDRKRLLMWMFVDGVPIVDTSLFTVDDPTARHAATVSDLEAIYQGGQ